MINQQTKEKMKCECLANFDFGLAVKILDMCEGFTNIEQDTLIKRAMDNIDTAFKSYEGELVTVESGGLEAELYYDGCLTLQLNLMPLSSFSFEKE